MRQLLSKVKHHILLVSYRLLVKFRVFKQSSMTAEQLNQLVQGHFPQSFKLAISTADAECTLLEAELFLPENRRDIHLAITCQFRVTKGTTELYRAHILADISAVPHFSWQDQAIQLIDIQVSGLHLIQDEYALISNTRQIMGKILPSGVQSLLSGTVNVASRILTGDSLEQTKEYFSLYLSGSKQKILDYHTPEITLRIQEFVEQNSFSYQLNTELLEERVFAELGTHVDINDGRLWFRFNGDRSQSLNPVTD